MLGQIELKQTRLCRYTSLLVMLTFTDYSSIWTSQFQLVHDLLIKICNLIHVLMMLSYPTKMEVLCQMLS